MIYCAYQTVVRQPTQRALTITNPLSDDKIVFAAPKCSHRGIRVTQLGDFTGKPEGTFNIEYLPLVPTPAAGPEEVELVLQSEQLGVYSYTLSLKALPAPAEHAVRFEADLGNSHKQTIR